MLNSLPNYQSASSVGDLMASLCGTTHVTADYVLACDLTDNWGGFEAVSENKRHRLFRIGDGYRGFSRLEIGRDETAAELSASTDVLENFIATLAACPIVPGRYKPFEDVTDSYPYKEVALVLAVLNRSHYETEFGPSGHLVIKSHSQRDYPWQLICDDTEWTIPTTGPAEALKSLSPYLNAELSATLLTKAEQAHWGRPLRSQEI